MKEIGLQLIESAGGASAHAAVLRSAAHLDWNNYVTKSHGEAQFVTVEVPDHVTKALAPIATHVDQQGTMYRLLSRYQPRPATPYRWVLAELPSDEDLKQDVADARNLQDALGEDDAVPLSRALAGVAAAIIRRASVSGANELSPESLVWSLSLLILCASSPRQGMFNQAYAYNPGGADRIAALALPWVLIGPDGDSGTAGSILECRLQAPVPDWKGAESSQRRERSLGIAYAGASLTAAGQSVGGTRLRGNGLRFQRADAGFP